MSREHEDRITLEEMIRQSTDIFIVEQGKPFPLIKDIKIHANTKKYPPFKDMTYHYRVIEVLSGKKELRGRRIKVIPAYRDMAFEAHKEYYLNGLSLSPKYQSYTPEFNLIKEKKVILFLFHLGTDQYKLVVRNAFESVKNQKKVRGLIDKIKKDKNGSF